MSGLIHNSPVLAHGFKIAVNIVYFLNFGCIRAFENPGHQPVYL
jgi:hypothetical protein